MVRKIAVVFIFIFVFIFLTFILFKSGKSFADFDCLQLTQSSTADQKQYCQNELSQLIQEQADLEAKLKAQSKQSGTLKGDITVLTTQINALKTQVKSRTLKIATLKVDINDKISAIQTLSQKINREHVSLAQLLRNTNDFDNQDFIYLMFSNDSLSTFYNDLESYTSIKEAVKSSVDRINGIKTETEVQKQDLVTKQDAELDAKAQLESAQKKVAQSEADKKQLLAISKNKEASYQLLVAQKKARADKISAALFQLRDTKAIPFGVALTYAKQVSQQTGVNPAFLLAIITQESNLGTDSGSCYVTDFDTGTGVSSKSGKIFAKVMHPTRDIPPFLSITKSLGRDPIKTLVSCPIGGYGYGGAMGPAQFIPSTWNLMIDRVASTLGVNTPDPWNPKDAFMASGIFLSDLGASSSYSSEMKAACKYYGSGGSSCAYGRSVMSKTSSIQDNIDYISNNS